MAVLDIIPVSEKEVDEDTANICLDEDGGLVEGECGYGGCGGFSDSRKFQERFDIGGKSAAIRVCHQFGDFHQRDGAPIVSQSMPYPEYVSKRRFVERGKARERCDEAFIFGNDPFDLGLLQHNLGNEDAVGVLCPSPGQVASVFGIILTDGLPEGADGIGIEFLVRFGFRRAARPCFASGFPGTVLLRFSVWHLMLVCVRRISFVVRRYY